MDGVRAGSPASRNRKDVALSLLRVLAHSAFSPGRATVSTSRLSVGLTVEEAEALLRAARIASNDGDLVRAKELHLRILSLYPRTPEADEAIRYLTNIERAAPQRVEEAARTETAEQRRTKLQR